MKRDSKNRKEITMRRSVVEGIELSGMSASTKAALEKVGRRKGGKEGMKEGRKE